MRQSEPFHDLGLHRLRLTIDDIGPIGCANNNASGTSAFWLAYELCDSIASGTS